VLKQAVGMGAAAAGHPKGAASPEGFAKHCLPAVTDICETSCFTTLCLCPCCPVIAAVHTWGCIYRLPAASFRPNDALSNG
jgi:hypothetical protein